MACALCDAVNSSSAKVNDISERVHALQMTASTAFSARYAQRHPHPID